MKTLIRRTVSFLTDTAFSFLDSSYKAVAGLATIGADRMLQPTRNLPNHTGLVVILGVLAALDALAYFGVMPERCTADRPCADCLAFVEKNGFYPYGATATAPLYTDPKETGR